MVEQKARCKSLKKVFGCISYFHISIEKRSKLDCKSVKYIFMGYSNKTKGFRFYDPTTKILIINHDIIFSEDA